MVASIVGGVEAVKVDHKNIMHAIKYFVKRVFGYAYIIL